MKDCRPWETSKVFTSGKDSDAGRDWRQEEKGTTEDEMAGWLGAGGDTAVVRLT